MRNQHIRFGALGALLAGLLAVPLAAEPSLVRDFRPGTEQIQAYPEIYAARLLADGILYFGASDPAHGQELWRTDGTPDGTFRLTDVCPGACDSNPSGMQLFRGEIYFAADDGVSGVELWASPGTPGNARRVRDLCPGPCDSEPQSLEVSGGRLLFIASSGSDWQLWSSGGSRRGTAAVRSFCPYVVTPDGIAHSCAYGLIRLGSVTLFQVEGRFWRTDGTAAGTRPLSDFVPGIPSFYQGARRLGDSIFFWAEDALWRTDGTAAGTRRIRTAAELGLDTRFLSFGRSIVWHGMLFWEVSWGRILRTDGTPEGTLIISDVPGQPNLIGFAPLDDRLLMQLQLPDAFWSTQGTPETTHPVEVDFPGYSYGVAAAGNRALVCVKPPDDDEPTQLWLSDGTVEGTQRAPFEAGDCSSLGYTPNVGGRAIYVGGLGELWGSDGTAAGTGVIHDFSEVPASGGPLEQIALGGQLLFSAETSETEAPLFLSDGTEAGTRVVSDEAGWGRGFARAGDRVFFEAFEPVDANGSPSGRSTGLWVTNGTPAGTFQVREDIGSYGFPMPVGRALFFSAAREYSYYGQPDLELFRSDGTRERTGLVKNINNYFANTGFHHTCYNAPSNPGPGIDLNGRLLFVADEGRNGRELWLSDGTAPGTRLLKDIDPRRVPGGGSDCDDRTDTGLGSEPRDFVRYRNGVLFTAADGKAGRELWWTDGTPAGTRRVADLRRGAQGSEPHDLVLFRGKVWFIASTRGVGEALWRTDGTPQGTQLVHALALGGLPSWARSLTVAGDRLFFQLYNETTGAELWASRGTGASTRMVADLRPGADGSYPQAMAAVEGRLVFAADDGVHGLEPWQSDGTAGGTVPLGDIHPGLDASSPGPFTPVAGGLVLTGADDGEHGRELWALPIEEGDPAATAGAPPGMVGTLF